MERVHRASDHEFVVAQLLRTGFVMAPNVIGTYRAQAEQQLRAEGLQPRFTGSTDLQGGVWRQDPSGGREVRAGSTVTCDVADPNAVRVPDVVGWYEGTAVQEISDAGLQPRVYGLSGHPNAQVERQDPWGGTPVAAESTVGLGLSTDEPK